MNPQKDFMCHVKELSKLCLMSYVFVLSETIEIGHNVIQDMESTQGGGGDQGLMQVHHSHPN